FFFFQAEDGIRDKLVTGVQTCALPIFFGVLTQLAAAGLILLMLGAIQKKIFIWRTGFWGESGTNGWSYHTMLVVMSLVIVTTGRSEERRVGKECRSRWSGDD